MAGLLAWAADVVGGGGGQSNGENESISIPIIFTDEQRKYVQELDQKAASLSRSIKDLRLRLPPPDISQRLPHLHAHSIASNAALALQLNSHSATREQVCFFFNFSRFSKFELFLFWVTAILCIFLFIRIQLFNHNAIFFLFGNSFRKIDFLIFFIAIRFWKFIHLAHKCQSRYRYSRAVVWVTFVIPMIFY